MCAASAKRRDLNIDEVDCQLFGFWRMSCFETTWWPEVLQLRSQNSLGTKLRSQKRAVTAAGAFSAVFPLRFQVVKTGYAETRPVANSGSEKIRFGGAKQVRKPRTQGTLMWPSKRPGQTNARARSVLEIGPRPTGLRASMCQKAGWSSLSRRNISAWQSRNGHNGC